MHGKLLNRSTRNRIEFLVVFLIAFLLAGAVVGQDTEAGPDGQIILGPLIDYILELAIAALAAVLTWGFRRASTKLGLSIDADHSQLIDKIAERAANYARQKLAGPDGRVTAAIRNEVIEAAAQYLVDSVPDALRHFGIDPESTDKRVRDIVSARFPVDSDPEVPVRG